MPKEKASYRDNLEAILGFLREKYNDSRHILRIRDVQEYSGFSYDYVKKHFILGRDKAISAEKFARILS